jgi:hypothetical protein
MVSTLSFEVKQAFSQKKGTGAKLYPQIHPRLLRVSWLR